MKILNIVGTRPNFIKIAPLMNQMSQKPAIKPILLHTGQHYDESMSKIFFRATQNTQARYFSRNKLAK